MEELKAKIKREYWNDIQRKHRAEKRKQTKCWPCPDRTNDETFQGPCSHSPKRWLTINYCRKHPFDARSKQE